MSHGVVLDTNVLVSAGLKPDSAIGALVERALLRSMPVHVCPSLVAEYQTVMARPKFRRAGFLPAWLPRLMQVAFHEPEPAPWPHEGPDPDDLVFLALAKVTGTVLITGNTADFPPAIRAGVRVMTPTAYLEQHR